MPPSEMGVGPAYAIPAVLADCGLTTDDIDIFEINEAFASQAPRSRGMASHVEWHPTRHRVAIPVFRCYVRRGPWHCRPSCASRSSACPPRS